MTTEVEARQELEDRTAASIFPTLTPDEITALLENSRRPDIGGVAPDYDFPWEPLTIYVVGDTVVPTSRTGHVYKVTDPGTSGAVEPTWPTGTGQTVTLDGVTYAESNIDTTYWAPTYDLNSAASLGWRKKAGKVSNRHTFGSNQGNYNPEQVFKHCMDMADHFASKVVAMVAIPSRRWNGTGGLPSASNEDAV